MAVCCPAPRAAVPRRRAALEPRFLSLDLEQTRKQRSCCQNSGTRNRGQLLSCRCPCYSAQPFCEGARVFRYAAVLLLLLSWPAIAEVHLDYTFSQWEKLQDDDRSAYIAGLIDSLETMAATEAAQRTAQHYSQCLMRSRLTARELADFLREYVRARPEMQGTSVPRAINDYLNVLCGRPFD
jgi:hypothetical protein